MLLWNSLLRYNRLIMRQFPELKVALGLLECNQVGVQLRILNATYSLRFP